MASIVGSAENGMFGSKDYDLIALDLINSGGQTVPLKKVFVEMQIFQDLYSSVMSGNILINDGNDIFSNFYFMGNEYLLIKIDKPGLGRPFERVFRVYKTTNREPTTDSGQSYVLHFCSDELISSEQILLSKAYKSRTITDIIRDILLRELSVDPARIASLESTAGTYDLIVPGYRPMEAIQWATSRAYNQNKFCYFFFENKNGFNLTSLQTLIKQKPYKKLKYELKNNERDPANNKDSIDNLDIDTDFDMINSISNGAFAAKMKTVDVFSQSFEYVNYNLQIAEAQNNLINKHKPVNSFKNIKNETLFQAGDSFFRTYLSVNDTASERSNDIKYWLLPRATHMVMLNHFKIRVTLPGDIEMKAGDIIEYEFPLFESANKAGKKLDKKRTARYLVSAVNHKFSEDVFETIAELVSDSYADQLPAAKEGLIALVKKGK